MVAPLVVSVLLLVLVAGLVWAVLAHERTDETERFNRAREITSSWAGAEPVLVPDDAPGHEQTDHQR